MRILEVYETLPIVRIFEAVRRIGYTPVSAVLDIIDNSVVAKADKINIQIETKPNPQKPSKDTITDIVIYDNGSGMEKSQMFNALTLGSPDSDYENNSLSKFGFGLKSAGLSQANTISLLSKTEGANKWVKMVLDWETIKSKNDYIILDNEPIDDFEKSIIEKSSGFSSGTIVRLTNIMQVNSAKDTVIMRNLTAVDTFKRNLKLESSMVYHRFIESGQVQLSLNGELIEPFDPLFLSEAKGSFSDYDGTITCKIITEPLELPLNIEKGTTMFINAVQLPYPPMFKREGRQEEVRSRHRMRVKNIGFYIYRNDRLICMGEKLGLVPSDQDYMSFRASIDLKTESDDDVNLDVLKMKVIFPDYAHDSIDAAITPLIRMSKKCWSDMKRRSEDPTISEPEKAHERSNMLLDKTEPTLVDVEEGETRQTESIIKREKNSLKKHYKHPSSFSKIMEGKKQRIRIVDELPFSRLWEPVTDDEGKTIVLISKSHPFYGYVYKKLDAGGDALVILDALFLNLSMAELSIAATNKSLIKNFETLRISASAQLSRFIEANMDDDDE